MQGATYRGLYQNQTSWAPSFNCPSDCKWPGNYTVLGFAGSCEDVAVPTLATKNCDHTNVGVSYLTNCNMTTPRGISIDTVTSANEYRTVSILNSTSQPFLTVSAFRYGPQISTYAFYNTRANQGPGVTNYTYKETVWECSLNLTAYMYLQVTSTNNDFRIGNIERIPLETGHQVGEGDDIMFNQSGMPELSIAGRDLEALRGFFLSSLFTGISLQGVYAPDAQLGCNSAFARNSASDVTTRLAKSMTDALQGNSASQQYTGSYAQAVTFIRVRWVWLILLGVLEVAGIVLLVGKIVRAR
jgi:hypothetical protein